MYLFIFVYFYLARSINSAHLLVMYLPKNSDNAKSLNKKNSFLIFFSNFFSQDQVRKRSTDFFKNVVHFAIRNLGNQKAFKLRRKLCMKLLSYSLRIEKKVFSQLKVNFFWHITVGNCLESWTAWNIKQSKFHFSYVS